VAGAWPLMPEWVAVPDAPVHRGDSLRVTWNPPHPGAGDGHELRLALVVHHKVRMSTSEGLAFEGGRFGIERQVWIVHDRAPVTAAAGAALLHVPPGVPYSYPGSILAFFWGVALADEARQLEEPIGWSAVKVLP